MNSAHGYTEGSDMHDLQEKIVKLNVMSYDRGFLDALEIMVDTFIEINQSSYTKDELVKIIKAAIEQHKKDS